MGTQSDKQEIRHGHGQEERKADVQTGTKKRRETVTDANGYRQAESDTHRKTSPQIKKSKGIVEWKVKGAF